MKFPLSAVASILKGRPAVLFVAKKAELCVCVNQAAHVDLVLINKNGDDDDDDLLQ